MNEITQSQNVRIGHRSSLARELVRPFLDDVYSVSGLRFLLSTRVISPVSATTNASAIQVSPLCVTPIRHRV